MGEPRLDMGEGRGLEVLMTEGWPTMPPMGGGWEWEWGVPMGPEESGEERPEREEMLERTEVGRTG